MIRNLRDTYQLKVLLKGAKPPIWRRLELASSATLEELHFAIQITMGWSNSHLHQFMCDDIRYGIVGSEGGMEWDEFLQDERIYKLKDVLRSEGDSLFYLYDFGDDWEHDIRLEKILPFDPNENLPRCTKGKRAAPPEDVGGVGGYEYFLEQLRDEHHPEHDAVLEWVGDFFDPEHFDIVEANMLLDDLFSELSE